MNAHRGDEEARYCLHHHSRDFSQRRANIIIYLAQSSLSRGRERASAEQKRLAVCGIENEGMRISVETMLVIVFAALPTQLAGGKVIIINQHKSERCCARGSLLL